jgi:hypothetical protein
VLPFPPPGNPPPEKPPRVKLPKPPPPGKEGVVELTTVICAPRAFLSRLVVCVDAPAEIESSTRIIATPITIPETVKIVLVLRRRRLFTAKFNEDILCVIRKVGAQFLRYNKSPESLLNLYQFVV